jgi:hypothetical protein
MFWKNQSQANQITMPRQEMSPRERVNFLLAKARSERWHAGTQRILYSDYVSKISRAAGNNRILRDEAVKQLRSIFNMG